MEKLKELCEETGRDKRFFVFLNHLLHKGANFFKGLGCFGKQGSGGQVAMEHAFPDVQGNVYTSGYGNILVCQLVFEEQEKHSHVLQ